MIFDKEGNTTVVFQENASLQTFLKNLNESYSGIRNDHIIINLSSFSTLKSDELLVFLQLSDAHRKSGKSFVLVTDTLHYSDLPDHICVAPTLQEARDIIEMEEIERDLEL